MESKLLLPVVLIYFSRNKEGKPILKQKSVARMVELKEEYDLCDI